MFVPVIIALTGVFQIIDSSSRVEINPQFWESLKSEEIGYY